MAQQQRGKKQDWWKANAWEAMSLVHSQLSPNHLDPPSVSLIPRLGVVLQLLVSAPEEWLAMQEQFLREHNRNNTMTVVLKELPAYEHQYVVNLLLELYAIEKNVDRSFERAVWFLDLAHQLGGRPGEFFPAWERNYALAGIHFDRWEKSRAEGLYIDQRDASYQALRLLTAGLHLLLDQAQQEMRPPALWPRPEEEAGPLLNRASLMARQPGRYGRRISDYCNMLGLAHRIGLDNKQALEWQKMTLAIRQAHPETARDHWSISQIHTNIAKTCMSLSTPIDLAEACKHACRAVDLIYYQHTEPHPEARFVTFAIYVQLAGHIREPQMILNAVNLADEAIQHVREAYGHKSKMSLQCQTQMKNMLVPLL
jgi:hypothetical protein